MRLPFSSPTKSSRVTGCNARLPRLAMRESAKGIFRRGQRERSTGSSPPTSTRYSSPAASPRVPGLRTTSTRPSNASCSGRGIPVATTSGSTPTFFPGPGPAAKRLRTAPANAATAFTTELLHNPPARSHGRVARVRSVRGQSPSPHPSDRPFEPAHRDGGGACSGEGTPGPARRLVRELQGHDTGRMRKNSQAAQKGPDARRRPRAAREAYSLYVERAAEGAKFLGGGLRPPSETSPQDSLRRQSRRSKVEHSCLIGDGMWLRAGRALPPTLGCSAPSAGFARAPKGGGFGGGRQGPLRENAADGPFSAAC